MQPTCRVIGCSGRAASSYSHYCRKHKARLRRHGAVDQKAITAADLRPHLASVRTREKKNEANPVWKQLEARWLRVVEHAESVIAHYKTGKAGRTSERQAAYEAVKLADLAKPREVVEVVLAMFVMQALEPTRFRSDAAFRAQLARRTRALGDANVGLSYDNRTGKVRRVYRDLPPKAAAVIGQWLAEALGGAGIRLAQLEQQGQGTPAQ